MNLGTVNDPFFSGQGSSTLSEFGNETPNRGPYSTLAYPLDTPKYIMTFSISKYDRTDLNTIGKFVDAGYPGIILPLPQQLQDVNHVNWHEVEVGTLPGTFISGLGQMTKGEGLTGSLAALTAGAFGASFLANLGSVGSKYIPSPGQMVQGGEAMLGFSPNQFLTLLMRGPTYKRHKFNWELAPDNYEEANILNKIVTTFKNAMAPNVYAPIAGIPVLWTFPKIFRIRLYPNSKFLYKFKPCICDYFIVDDAPAGRASFRRNGTGQQGDNPPAVVRIQANFIELEFWIEGQYGSGTTSDPSNDPSDVYKKLPA